MSAEVLPIADHGGVVSFLPFVAPMVLIVGVLVFLALRDRLGRGGRGDQ